MQRVARDEQPLRRLDLTDDEWRLLTGFRFITQKPAMVLLNIDEKDIGKEPPEDVRKYCGTNGFTLMSLSGKIEEEISECPPEEQTELLEALGIKERALPKFIHDGLRPARPDIVPDDGGQGGPRVEHHAGNDGVGSRREDPHGHAEGIHSRGGGGLR